MDNGLNAGGKSKDARKGGADEQDASCGCFDELSTGRVEPAEPQPRWFAK